MNVVKVVPAVQYWAYRKDIGRIFGIKDPSRLLQGFREFCEKRPNFFNPVKPLRKDEGFTLYNVFAVAYYFENRSMLDAGTRSLKFKDDLPRLIEAYSLHVYGSEVI